MLEMTEREKFLFDLQGFLVVRDFLTDEEVKALNEAFDANVDEEAEGFYAEGSGYGGGMDGTHRAATTTGMLTWDPPWCQPYRDLIAHPKLVPYLNTLFGQGWRMDEQPFIITARKGSCGHGLHGASSWYFDEGMFYHHQNGRIRTGMAVFQFQLVDINPGDGGVAVIPGSHKANFKCPEDILLHSTDQEAVRNVATKAGDLVIFLEATLHGALPWTADHNRRSLLYRYVSRYLNFHHGMNQTSQPDWVSELTEVQRAALEPPYVYNRPVIEDDGASLSAGAQDVVPYRPRHKDGS